MLVEQFLIQPPSDILVNSSMLVLVALGVVLIAIGVSSKLLDAIRHLSIGFHSNKYVAIVGGILILVVGIGLFFNVNAPSTVTVGSGYVDVKFSMLSPIPFVGGEMNITASEIATAYTGRIGAGAFTLDKQYGLNSGNTNIGVFKLGNGATAYIASTNSTGLIIQLKTGEYIIVGNSDTEALARSFSENVYALKSP
jgi:hypothetical protein